MKIAMVTPVFKVDDRTEISNYRPISILPLFSKILEKVMFERTMIFQNKYHILFDNQYSFNQNHSTYITLLETIDRVSDALDKKSTTVGVFIDLFKAFDTVDHIILLNKLDNYGIKGLALDGSKII